MRTMTNSPLGPRPLVFTDAAPSAAAQDVGPKALSFGPEPVPAVSAAAMPSAASARGVEQGCGPKPLSFGPTEVAAQEEPVARSHTPGALSFAESLPTLNVVEPVKALFEQDAHPAMRAAIETARELFSDMYRRETHRMDAHFRKLLPIRVSSILEWAEKHVARGPELSLQAASLIQQFAALNVQAHLAEALESTKPPTGLLQKLLQRQRAPAEFLPLLREAGAAVDRIRSEAEKCSSETQDFAEKLTVQLCSLAVIAKMAGPAPDAALGEALSRRQAMIQQTVQQAGLSILQLADLRRQAVDLSSQISSFLTVTLPAIAMAQAQKNG
jgi:hypothetical protein